MKILRIISVVALVLLGVFGVQWYLATSRGAGDLHNLVMNQRYFSSEKIAENLNARDRDVAISSMTILAERKSGLATDTAKIWLNSEHDWLHGARYLGEFGDRSSIPYLIRGLDHPYASGLYDGISTILTDLTGQKFGTNKEQWIQWWESANPDSNFDFSTKSAIIPSRYRDPEQIKQKKQNPQISIGREAHR